MCGCGGLTDCRKEINATLENQNPIILLHEADIKKGGLSLEQCKAECPNEMVKHIFMPTRPVIPWMRIKVRFVRDFVELAKLIIGDVCGPRVCAPGRSSSWFR